MSDRLLIIEDNEQNLYMMRFLLEKNGFRVVCEENGPSGIREALHQKPNAVLLDIQLPEMDGYAVAAELRRHRRTGGCAHRRGDVLRHGGRSRKNPGLRGERVH